jgi:hypothetical protein
MSRRLKVIGVSLFPLGFLSIVVVLGLPYYLFRNACDRVESVLSRDSLGRTVTSTFEACTTIGTSTREWVDLVLASGRRRRVLTFVPWGGELSSPGVTVREPFEPVVTWANPSAMHISIGTVSQLSEQHDDVDGVRITYSIGTIIYR